MATETEPIPNPVVGHSERVAGKSKKRNGLWKPNTELPPNRTCGAAMSEIWWSRSEHLGGCRGPAVMDALFPGALSLRILKLLFVRSSDQFPELTWRRLLHEVSMQKLAHLWRQNIVAHRVVNLGVRAVHRATDTNEVLRFCYERSREGLLRVAGSTGERSDF